MPVASGSQSILGYLAEITYGIPVTGSPFKTFRRRSAAGLNLTKDAYDSEEIRQDRMTSDSRHGIRKSGGDIETEVSVDSYNEALEALMGGTWAPVTGVTESVSVDIDGTAATGVTTLTRASGDFKTLWKIGGRVALTNLAAANTANQNKNATIIGINSAGTIMTLDVVLVDDTADTITITGVGQKLKIGGIARSFTFERGYTDLAVPLYQVFTGCRFNSAAFTLPPTGLATATWNILGQDARALITSSGSTGAYTAAATGSVLAAIQGVIAISDATNGARVLGVVTDMNFTIDNGMGGSEVVGKNVIPDQLYGNSQQVTGSITVLFEDNKLYNLFESESEATVVFRMDAPPDEPGKFLSFTMPRCKFNTGGIGDAVATGLPVQMEFRALRPRSTALGVDLDTQISVHTSA